MNTYSPDPIEMEVPAEYVKEVGECLLHSLFFIRALISTLIEETTIPSLLDYPYTRLPKRQNNERIRQIYQKIDEAINKIPVNSSGKKVEFEVTFQRKSQGWFFSSATEILEKWSIILNVLHFSGLPKETVISELSNKQRDLIDKAQQNSENQGQQFKNTDYNFDVNTQKDFYSMLTDHLFIR